MQHQIRTKWHRLVQLAQEDEVYFTAPKDIPNTKNFSKHISDYRGQSAEFLRFLEAASQLPKFVMDPDLVEIATSDNYNRSLMDMQKAGVLRLPFPAMVVEIPQPKFHMIVVIMDPKQRSVFFEAPTKDSQAEKADCWAVCMRIHRDEHGEYIILSPSVVYITLKNTDGELGISIEAYASEVCGTEKTVNVEDLNKLVGITYLKDGADAYNAACAAWLLMSTEGVEKEVIEVQRLNKKRKESGKVAIPRHTYIHIGRVCRSAGSDQSDAYDVRRSPRPHWRRGHNRHVRFGVGREQLRLKYIKPKLVAFHGDALVDEPKMSDYTVTK